MKQRDVSGRVAIVTGGARGLGAAHVRALVEAGAKVVCADVLVEEGEALAASYPDGNVKFHRLDVVDEAAWDETIAAAEQAFGPVSILVNNAGIIKFAKIEQMTVPDIRRILDVNAIGTFLGMQRIVPSMRKAGGGSIVNISSISGLAGGQSQVAYAASKFAVRGMTKVAALEFAADNIRVNSVHPGGIATQMTANLPALSGIPIPRYADPSEIANVMLFLASDDASYCTGAEFVVDGGYTAMVGPGPVRHAS